MSELMELEHAISIRIIQEDAESIYSLMQTEKDPVFLMEIVPYYALFVQSCQEYIGENLLAESVAKEIKDIRNHIKIYADGFGKSRKRVASVDGAQDRDFKEQLRFTFLKEMNIHLNLGTYWTSDRKIIGNTQQLTDFLSVDSMFDPKLGKQMEKMGCEMGTFVNSLRNGLAESLSCPSIERTHIFASVDYYCDINTNKNNALFSEGQSKEINLFFLHLLCNMNFVKYVLRPLFIEGNTWVFRVGYVVSYYTLRALERLKNYCENNKDIIIETKEIADILNHGEKLFKSQLRNCMMHYNLEGANVISMEKIDKPFFGIIENCFDGMNYNDYLKDLHSLSDKIAIFLDSQFDFSDVELKRL